MKLTSMQYLKAPTAALESRARKGSSLLTGDIETVWECLTRVCRLTPGTSLNWNVWRLTRHTVAQGTHVNCITPKENRLKTVKWNVVSSEAGCEILTQNVAGGLTSEDDPGRQWLGCGILRQISTFCTGWLNWITVKLRTRFEMSELGVVRQLVKSRSTQAKYEPLEEF